MGTQFYCRLRKKSNVKIIFTFNNILSLPASALNNNLNKILNLKKEKK